MTSAYIEAQKSPGALETTMNLSVSIIGNATNLPGLTACPEEAFKLVKLVKLVFASAL